MSDWVDLKKQLDKNDLALDLIKHVKCLEAKLKIAEKAIELYKKSNDFYADITSWEAREITNDHWEEWNEEDDNTDIFIGGKLARETQKKVSEVLNG